MACRHDATHYVHPAIKLRSNTLPYQRISNYGIGRDVVLSTGCGYKPMGAINGETWEHDGYSSRITLCENINIPNWSYSYDGARVFTGKIADTPTKDYWRSGGRHLPFRGLGALYDVSSNVTKINASNIVCDDILQIGQTLAYYINAYGCPKRNYLNAVCRDNNTGSEDILNGYPLINKDLKRQIAYGNWYKDYMPDIIKYADHVTVFRPSRDLTYSPSRVQGSDWGNGGYLAHPLYSYFRSASILYSNTRTPNNISESDAENETGNLVFQFSAKDTSWTKLCEIETWSTTRVYPHVHGVGDYFGGSRTTLYYRVRRNVGPWKGGLEIGASGEMGNRWVDECQSDYGSLASLSGQCIAYEMVVDYDYRNPGDSVADRKHNGPYVSACFAGHGVNIKARVKSVD